MLSFGEKKLQELNEESGETTWHVIAKNGDIEIIQKNILIQMKEKSI